ncbi:MAG: AI-2E family transporter, partial [Akkermansia sp.]|nr:AI-2E family transporter [Akkermansia sp.]
VIHHVCAQTYFSFTRFIGGQLTEAIILGVLCYIGMLIFGFPNAAIISLIICVTALVPVVGALIGAFIYNLQKSLNPNLQIPCVASHQSSKCQNHLPMYSL